MALTVLILICLFIIIGIIYNFGKGIGKSSVGNAIITQGATAEFQNTDKRKAVDQVLELAAHKKMEEQDDGDLFEKRKDQC